MKPSIRSVLVMGIIGLQFITVSAILFSSYVTTEAVLLGHARQIMENVASDTIDRSEDFLSPAQTAADLTQRLADHNVLSSDNPKSMERYFFEQLRLYPQFAGIYFGATDGSFFYVKRDEEFAEGGFRTKVITQKGEDRHVELLWRDANYNETGRNLDLEDTYDPRTRPWFKKALSTKDLVWTDPYIFFTSRQPGITTAAPVYDRSGTIRGVVGVDIEITEISTFLNRLKIGDSGSAFILNQNSDVIAFPDADKIKVPSSDNSRGLRFTRIEELDDALSRAAFASLSRSGSAIDLKSQQFTTFEFTGDTYHAIFAPFKNPNWPWVIAIHVPEDDFLGQIKDNQVFNVYMAMAIAVLACLVGFLLWRSIAQPMAALRANALAITSGDLASTTVVRSRYTEIQETADAFSHMVAALKQHEIENSALTEGLRTFSRAVEQSPAAIIITTDNGNIEYINPSFTSLTGYTIGEVSGLLPRELVGQETLSEECKDLLTVVTSGRIWRGELRLKTKSGREIWCAMTVSPVRNAEGGKGHFIAIAEDITERKEAQEALKAARDELEIRVEERTRELREEVIDRKRAEERAETANRVKSRFLANMSHELRTPLNAIIGFSDVIRRELFGPMSSPKYMDYACNIHESGTHLLQLINDTLDLSAIEAGKLALHEEKMDLADVSAAAQRLITPRAESGKVTLESAIDPDLPYLFADELRVKQILINLLSNAVKFTPEGGLVTLSITLDAKSDFIIKIKDTGIGMDEAGISIAMEVFGHVTSAFSKEHEGTGLGLPLTQKLVQAHDGSLHIASALGVGTTVTVKFPAARAVPRYSKTADGGSVVTHQQPARHQPD